MACEHGTLVPGRHLGESAPSETTTAFDGGANVREPQVLIAFDTTEGQTEKIANRMADVLRGDGASVDLHTADSAPAPDGYDSVVVGGSIHVGKFGTALTDYVTANLAALNAMPAALFQVSLTSANPDDEHTAAAHGMLQAMLDDTGFDPDLVAMFAGAVVYTKYGWIKRRIMRSIVAAEGGDTDTRHDHEYTDWAAVDHFAHDVLAHARAASGAKR
jgi:menaquinone-dependent protoporphyrinogen oxidase